MTRKTISLTIAAALCLAAQTPQPPLISAFYSLDNAKTNDYRWMAIDDPLKLTIDSTGRPHLGLNMSRAVFSINLNNYVRVDAVPAKEGTCHPSDMAFGNEFHYICPPDGKWRQVAYSDWQ